MKLPVTKQGMIQTTLGSIFYLMSDGRTRNANDPKNFSVSGKTPILCFHMTPRSSDEYFEVLPLLASGSSSICDNNDNDTVNKQPEMRGRVVIAFDMPGYGASENPPRSCTIDEISDAFLMAADSILLDTPENSDGNGSSNYITIGSLLGNYCCVSLASRYPKRIKAGILTNPWYNPAATEPSSTPLNAGDFVTTAIKDSFELKDDGSHLVQLHSKRNRWLDPELNFRVVHSEISYLAKRRIRYAKGINIQGDFDFQTPVQKIVEIRHEGNADVYGKFLCILGERCAEMFDQFGLNGTKRMEEAVRLLIGTSDTTSSDCRVDVERLVGEKSTLNVVNQMPEEFAALCNSFLSKHGL